MQMQNNDNNAYLQLLLRSKQSFLTTPCTHGVLLALRCCSSFGDLILDAAWVFWQALSELKKIKIKKGEKVFVLQQ